METQTTLGDIYDVTTFWNHEVNLDESREIRQALDYLYYTGKVLKAPEGKVSHNVNLVLN